MNDTILIVDDDPIIQETLGILLKTADYKYIVASNGQECIDRIRNGFTGLVLLDVMMPVMDGWKTIEVLVNENLHGNVVICMQTAVTDPGHQMHALAQYVWDYIRKPYVMDDLVDAIEHAMEMLNARSSVA